MSFLHNPPILGNMSPYIPKTPSTENEEIEGNKYENSLISEPLLNSDISLYSDEILDCFSKKTDQPLKSFSITYIKEKISLGSSNMKMVFIGLMLFIMSSLSISISGYFYLMNFLGFTGHGLITDIALAFGVMFSSWITVVILARFIDNTRIFKFQKMSDNAKKLIKECLNSDSSTMVQKLQEQLYQKLESKNIQSNTYVYHYLKESINRLEGEYYNLLYRINIEKDQSECHFQSFELFIHYYEKIDNQLNDIDSIQFINGNE